MVSQRQQEVKFLSMNDVLLGVERPVPLPLSPRSWGFYPSPFVGLTRLPRFGKPCNLS